MGQIESSVAGASAFALPPSQPSPIKEEYQLDGASNAILSELTAVADTFEKKKIGLFRPGEPGTLPCLSPGLLTVFVDVERLLVHTSGGPNPYKRADGVFALKRKRGGCFGMDKTVPDSKYSYERLPEEYEESLSRWGLPFPEERTLRNEKPLYIYFRKHLQTFLEELRSSGACQVVAFTSMVKERADAILDCIEGLGKGDKSTPLFQGRLYRENCCWVPKPSGVDGARLLQPELVAAAACARSRMSFVKDFLIAAPFVDSKRCIIIDNNAVGCAAHLKNGICLRKFGGEDDDVLLGLKTALIQYATNEDVRDVCMGGDLYRSWTAFKNQRPIGLPDLTAEGDGTRWILEQPYPYDPVEEPIKKHTGREICFGANSDDSEVKKVTDLGGLLPVRERPQGPLRSILRTSNRCESGSQEGPIASKIAQRVPANHARRIPKKLQKQLALQDEISILLEEDESEPTPKEEVTDTASLQKMIADLRATHIRMMEAHSQLVACTSS